MDISIKTQNKILHRIYEIMGKHKNKKAESKFGKMWEKIKKYAIQELLATVLVSVITAIIGFSQTLTKLNASMESMNSTIETNYNSLHNEISTINSSMNSRLDSMESRFSKFEQENYYKKLFTLTSSAVEDFEVKTVSYTMPEFLSQPSWDANEIISIDNVGKTYTSGDLIDQKILFGYQENGQEIVFYGQYDEMNRWDGECLLNIYSDNQLVMINQVIFNHGDMVNYKQVFSDKIKDNDVWIVGNRACSEEYNIGDTYTYNKIKSVEKDFSVEDVSETDLIFFDSFKTNLDKKHLISFYHGNTSNGLYNDTTGGAYMAKYNDNGYIATLYRGNFANGQFDDNTNNAWYITKDKNTDYMYYKGKFENGRTLNNKESKFVNPVSLDEINKIVSANVYDCELKWEISGDL